MNEKNVMYDRRQCGYLGIESLLGMEYNNILKVKMVKRHVHKLNREQKEEKEYSNIKMSEYLQIGSNAFLISMKKSTFLKMVTQPPLMYDANLS